MKNSSPISLKTDNLSVETEGARRATVVSTDSGPPQMVIFLILM